MYARGVNVNLTPLTSKRGALATDARCCSLWRSLLECSPRAWESQVRDPLGTRYELGRCGPGRGCYISFKSGVRSSLGKGSVRFKVIDPSLKPLTTSSPLLLTFFSKVQSYFQYEELISVPASWPLHPHYSVPATSTICFSWTVLEEHSIWVSPSMLSSLISNLAPLTKGSSSNQNNVHVFSNLWTKESLQTLKSPW